MSPAWPIAWFSSRARLIAVLGADHGDPRVGAVGARLGEVDLGPRADPDEALICSRWRSWFASVCVATPSSSLAARAVKNAVRTPLSASAAARALRCARRARLAACKRLRSGRSRRSAALPSLSSNSCRWSSCIDRTSRARVAGAGCRSCAGRSPPSVTCGSAARAPPRCAPARRRRPPAPGAQRAAAPRRRVRPGPASRCGRSARPAKTSAARHHSYLSASIGSRRDALRAG